MTHEGPLEEWMKKLSEESLKDNTFDRRRFIQGAGKIAGLSLGLAIAQSMGAMEVNAAPTFSEYPFTLGVASGDPLSDSVVLWTRLAPDPLNGGGMPNEAVSVKWEIAEDERFRRIVKRGTEKATPHLAHSVHAEVSGLKPNHVYYYRFKCGSQLSPVGKTKNASGGRGRCCYIHIRFCFMPAVRTRLLYRLSAYGEGKARSCVSSRRLYL